MFGNRVAEPSNCSDYELTMKLVATIEILVFYLAAFGLRSLWQWRQTGSTGFVGVRPGAGALERFAGGLLVLAFALGPVAPWVGEPLWQRGQPIGAALAAAGIALTLVAQFQMGASWRIGVSANERTTLVTSGVFRVVRNPIFSAMLFASVGLALAAPTSLALALPVMCLLSLELQVRLVEEPYLLSVHGAQYREWAARTGRFVPWLGRLGA